MDKDEILRRFERQSIEPEQLRIIELMTHYFHDIAEDILEITRPNREQSLALTALEEAKYWVNQSIAQHGAAAPFDEIAPKVTL